MTEITFNGDKEVLDGEYTVIEFLRKNEFGPETVTVSLNGSILSKEDFAAVVLKTGDSVDVLLFMGGGQ